MKVLKPSYYNKFKCIGGKCEETCCNGWRIFIDKDTYKKYKKVKDKFGIKLKKSMEIQNKDKFGSYGQFILDENQRCKFLDENNLCEIYKNLGPKNLCLTCKTYPRVYNYYNNLMEKRLVLSCPEVARIFVNTKAPMEFDLVEEEIEDFERYIVRKDYDEEIYNFLFEMRSFYIEIIQYSAIPIWKRIYFLIRFQERIQKIFDQKKYDEITEVINTIRIEITDEKVISNLDKIEKQMKIKLLFMENYATLDYTWEVHMNLHKAFNEYVASNKDYSGKLTADEEKFEEYFRDREYILENYIVSRLYSKCIKVNENNDLKEDIIKIIVNYMILKFILMFKYISDKSITEEDIVKIITQYSRCSGDNAEAVDNGIYKEIVRMKYDSIGYLVSFVR